MRMGKDLKDGKDLNDKGPTETAVTGSIALIGLQVSAQSVLYVLSVV